MITNGALFIFYVSIIGLVLIVSRNLRTNRNHLINKIYVAFSLILIEWMLALIGMRFTGMNNTFMLYIWDSLSNFGTSMAPVLLLLIAIVFTRHYDHLPAKTRWLLVVPVLTTAHLYNPHKLKVSDLFAQLPVLPPDAFAALVRQKAAAGSDLIGSVIEQMSRSPSTITVLGDHTLTHLASQGYFWPLPDPAKELRDHLKKRGEPA